MSILKRLCSVAAGAVVFITGLTGAFAADMLQLQRLETPLVLPADGPLVINGDAAKWRAYPEFAYRPLSELLRSGGYTDFEPLLKLQPAAVMQTCYDHDALYVAMTWTDTAPGTNQAKPGDAAGWYRGGEGFELHFITGSDNRIVHLACWPTPDGRGLSVTGGVGNEPRQDWSAQVKAAGRVTGEHTYFQELRIPWSLITGSALPAGEFRYALDLAWNALPLPRVAESRQIMIDTHGWARGVTYCYLTAGKRDWDTRGLYNPADWAAITLGDQDTGAVAHDWLGDFINTWTLGKAATPPVIDGNLDDWKKEQFRQMDYLPGLWPDRYHAQVAVTYDAANLYLAATFSCNGEIRNYKTEATQAGFGGGDNLQIRLAKAGKKVNLCVWPDTAAGNQPALTCDGVDLPNPFLLRQGAKAAYRLAPDKKSYSLELAVPWKLLWPAGVKTGDKLQFSLQPWWADFTTRYTVLAATSLVPRGALGIDYQMPRDAQVSLGLFDQKGRLIKWLRQNEYRAAGRHSVDWDGLDQYGEPAAAGDYVMRGVYHDPLATQYLATVNNPGNPPWPTMDDRGDWLSDEANTQAVATDGDWLYFAAPGGEYGFGVMATDSAGQRQWGVLIGNCPRSAAITVDGDYVYALFSDPMINDETQGHVFTGDNATGRTYLVCLDKKTGRMAGVSKEKPQFRLGHDWQYRNDFTYMWELRANQSFTAYNNGGQPRYFACDVAESTNALGIAATGGKLYVTYIYDNKIIRYDAATGKADGWETAVPAPAGIHTLDGNTLLVVSDWYKRVLKVDIATGKTSFFINDHLAAPVGVTADKSGNIYVSDWRESFQVKQFDKNGNFVKAIGKPGGRPWLGQWEKDGMILPRGIAVTGGGKLWVAEDDNIPKRISVWDTATGAFEKEYIGPSAYGGGGYFWIDPKDPARAISNAVSFKVDYKNNTYTPTATVFRRMALDEIFVPNGAETNLPAKVLYHGKDEYAVIQHTRGIYSFLKREGDLYRQTAAFGWRTKHPHAPMTGDGTQIVYWDSDLGYHLYSDYFPDFFRGKFNTYFAWNDTNGDRHAQAGEMTWLPSEKTDSAAGGVPPYESGWGGDVGPDFTIYFVAQFKDAKALFALSPKSWAKKGGPVYDLTKARVIARLDPKYAVSQLHFTRDNKIVIILSHEWGKDRDAVACYNLKGELEWTLAMPAKLEGDSVHGTGVIYDYEVPGIGVVCFTWNWHGNTRSYMFTTKGDYIGTPLEDGHFGPMASMGESFRSGYQTPDGKLWIINGANQSMHILNLSGLEKDKAGKFEVKYKLTGDAVSQAAAARATAAAAQAPEEKPAITIPVAKTAPVIDGKLDDWNLTAGVKMERGKRRTEIALTRDDKNLYLAYKVYEPGAPLRNGGADWQRLFITGDCVDLMLETVPKSDPKRVKAAAGDLRLLFTEFEGKPIAVLYRQVVPGTKEPILFMAANIDYVGKLDHAKVAVSRNEAEGYYIIEAAVPWQDLGFDLNPAGLGALRGDVGVIYANESGKSRVLRLYYYNQNTALVEDLTTETNLQPAEWGDLKLQK